MFATRKASEANPWAEKDEKDLSSTIEWLLPSPPSFHTFEEIPSIKASPNPQQLQA
jgi:heme/copper-type cytochrome/quinol oxidase subunit 1